MHPVHTERVGARTNAFKFFMLSVYTQRGGAEKARTHALKGLCILFTHKEMWGERERERSHKRFQGLVYSVYGERERESWREREIIQSRQCFMHSVHREGERETETE